MNRAMKIINSIILTLLLTSYQPIYAQTNQSVPVQGGTVLPRSEFTISLRNLQPLVIYKLSCTINIKNYDAKKYNKRLPLSVDVIIRTMRPFPVVSIDGKNTLRGQLTKESSPLLIIGLFRSSPMGVEKEVTVRNNHWQGILEITNCGATATGKLY